MMALLSQAVSAGLNLQTHTPVTSISRSTSSTGKWTVTTSRGTATANKVIFANNGYVAGLLPEYTKKIVPSRGICCRIVTPPGSKAPTLKYSYGLRFPNGSGDYLHQRPDGSIIVGGGRSHFFKDHSNWYNVVDDSELIAPAAHAFDTYMQDHFIGWEDSGAKVDQIWTGIMGYNADSRPSIGEVPGREGCYIAAGFEGHGMPLIYLTMKGIAEMVVDGKKYEEVRLPRIFKTTKERLESDIDNLIAKK